uniref:Tf2-1-like SH3-like domain-containing protein n=1 Tax=Nicotiana tabacum TaxID=4097 RepID=A0A1S4ATG8_TOBAC|nr:PREDICTED: uncharacterized protein LOC107801203 [Nicotiana tabacum]
MKLIQEQLKIAQSRQKSYTDIRRRDLEFREGDYVFLKVSPMKGIMRFGRKGKLSPRYIGPYSILERIGLVAYRLGLPPELSSLHPVFHVSMKKYFHYPSHVIDRHDREFNDTLSYEEVPVDVIDMQVRRLRTKDVASVKVMWSNHSVEKATWEQEEAMKEKYPYLFEFWRCSAAEASMEPQKRPWSRRSGFGHVQPIPHRRAEVEEERRCGLA